MKHLLTPLCRIIFIVILFLSSCSDDDFEAVTDDMAVYDEAELLDYTVTAITPGSTAGGTDSFIHLRFGVTGYGEANIVVFCNDGILTEGIKHISNEYFHEGYFRITLSDGNETILLDNPSAQLSISKTEAGYHVDLDAQLGDAGKLIIDESIDEPPVRNERTYRVIYNRGFESSILGLTVNYSVILPPSFDGRKRFPVMYMLHGAGSPNTAVLKDGDVDINIYLAEILGVCDEMVVVLPNGCFDGDNTYFCNGYIGGMCYEDFFIQEFMPEIESVYNVDGRREKRVITGYSMGGFGALLLGGKHPDRFGSVFAMSPRVWREGLPDLYSIWEDIDATQLPRLTMDIGFGDKLFPNAQPFHDFLERNNIRHRWIARPGSHDWDFWRVCLTTLLCWI